MMKKIVSVVVVALFAQMAVFAVSGTGKVLTVSADKSPVFKIEMLPGWSSKPWKYKTILIPPAKYPHIQLWCLKKGLSLAEAKKGVAELVKSEVLKFKTTKTEKIKIGGIDAFLLTGKGLEADDQDPSNAKVFLFSAGGRVFLLCIHGEGDEAAKMCGTVQKMLGTLKPVGGK